MKIYQTGVSRTPPRPKEKNGNENVSKRLPVTSLTSLFIRGHAIYIYNIVLLTCSQVTTIQLRRCRARTRCQRDGIETKRCIYVIIRVIFRLEILGRKLACDPIDIFHKRTTVSPSLILESELTRGPRR